MWKFWRRAPKEIPLAPPATAEVEALRRQVVTGQANLARVQQAIQKQTPPGRGLRTPGKKLVVILPLCDGDFMQAERQVLWWKELGGPKKEATLILLAPAAFDFDRLEYLQAQAELSFAHVKLAVKPFDLPNEKWPLGGSWAFLNGAQFCLWNRWDFLWLEPDCTALVPDWYERLKQAWDGCTRPFMGRYEPECPNHGYPAHMAGCGVYTWETGEVFAPDELGRAFDLKLGPYVVPRLHDTPLIAQVYGTPDPPPFDTLSDLEIIPAGAVLFHRNRDGRLINLLRQRRLFLTDETHRAHVLRGSAREPRRPAAVGAMEGELDPARMGARGAVPGNNDPASAESGVGAVGGAAPVHE